MRQSSFGMLCGRIGMTLFTMVHRFLCVRNGVPDVTGWGRLSVQYRRTSERSQYNANESTTVE
jgi:hypothetical protein